MCFRIRALVGFLCAAAIGAPTGAADKEILVDDIGDWTVEWFCGNPRNSGFTQGPRFEGASGGKIVFDKAGNGYVGCGTYIQLVPKTGPVRILAGTPGIKGSTDGPPWKAAFSGIRDIAMSPEDALYVCDGVDFTVKKLVRKGDGLWHTETIAGVPGQRGHRDGPARQALFSEPFESIAVDNAGVVYVLAGDWLKKIEQGVVTTLNAGTGRNDGPLAKAGFRRAMGGGQALAYDGGHCLYVADRWNQAVRKVDLQKNEVSTVAGALPGAPWGGPHDGKAFEARFHPGGGPCQIYANQRYGFLLVKAADEGGRIRWVADGWVKTFTPTRGNATVGPLAQVTGSPCGVDSEGNVYLTGAGGIRIARKKGEADK